MNGKAPKTIDPIRKAHIEECALHLERTANDFVEFAKDMGSEDYLGAMSLADSYRMAATELRRLDPEYVATEERNRQRVKEWQQAIRDHTKAILDHDAQDVQFPQLPDLETYGGPTRH